MWLRLISNTWSSCFHLRLEARATIPGLPRCQNSASSWKFCCHLSQKSHRLLRKPLFAHLLQILKQQRSPLGGGGFNCLPPLRTYCFPQGIRNRVSLGGWSPVFKSLSWWQLPVWWRILMAHSPLFPPHTEHQRNFHLSSRLTSGPGLQQGSGLLKVLGSSPHTEKGKVSRLPHLWTLYSLRWSLWLSVLWFSLTGWYSQNSRRSHHVSPIPSWLVGLALLDSELLEDRV